jgi:ABC-type xylose transport system substrate-binding protein
MDLPGQHQMNEAERDALLIRMDERTQRIQTDQRDHKSETKAAIQLLHSKFDKYVTQSQFSPVQKIVYGLVAIVLVAVASAVVAQVVSQGSP